MRKTLAISILTSASVMLAACSGASGDTDQMSFPIMNAQGAEIGTVQIGQLAGGGVDIEVDVTGLEPGTRAMHFHEFGLCERPGYTSSGGHYNPSGVPHGEHAGDMMNVEVGADGSGDFKVTNRKVNLREGSLPALLDADGTALVIHGGADDYTSQPSGAAGPRVACAVISAG